MSRLGAITFVMLAVTASDASAGQVTCSNPGLPVGSAASSKLLPGRLTLSLTSSLLPIAARDTVQGTNGALLQYDAGVRLLETRIATEYAVTPWIAIGASLPYRVIDVGVTYRDPETGVAVMGSPIHARDERLTGIGDAQLLVRLAQDVGDTRLYARAGTSLPLGRTEADPFLLGAIGQEHQHVQFGSGTLMPFAAVELQRTLALAPASVIVAAFGLAQLSLVENARGYQAGHRLSTGVSASSTLGLRAFTFGVTTELHTETGERWRGVVPVTEGNAGRGDLYVGGSVAWRPLPDLAIAADVKVPVYSYVNGGQLDYTAIVAVGVVKTFDLARKATWRGLDHASVGPPGSAPELVTVPGRVTVFDLWAAWCAPCRELDTQLEALARRYPDRIAIRKLDVVDPDSAAWKRYLSPGSFELPHIKVVREDGSVVFERTAPVGELLRAVEAVLAHGSAQVPR